MEKNQFWRSMLQKRDVADWGNFSWISIRMVLLSVNDTIAKQLDSTIVNRRRMRWVARQRDRGIDVEAPVRLAQDRVLVVGDPGEMDASQYVLLRDLFATDYEVLLLMSDVVYPAGDINAWGDAVYRPYFALPRWRWEEAVADWDEKVGGGIDAPLPPKWHVFAVPGNHDWYDGLTGFMWHSCGASILPRVKYSSENTTTRQRLSRALWRSPGHPNSPYIHPLRREVARRWSEGDGGPEPHTRPGPIPYQPGPYYSIDLTGRPGPADEDGERAALVRLVCVDNGIDGSIDVEQADWLERQLREEGLPKVVVLGKPLVVDNKVAAIPIEGGRWLDPLREEDPGEGAAAHGDRIDARDIIKGGRMVVATMAGDIHNAQRFVIGGDPVSDSQRVTTKHLLEVTHRPRPEPEAAAEEQRAPAAEEPQHAWSIARALEDDDRLPPLHFVAGGGGAYLTETHGIKIEADGALQLEDELVEGCTHDVPRGGFRSYPSREESVLLFAETIRRAPFVLALTAVALLSGVAAWVLATTAGGTGPAEANITTPDLGLGLDTASSIPAWRALLGSLSTAVLILVAVFSYLRPEGTSLKQRRWEIALGVAMLPLVVVGWYAPVDALLILLGGTVAAMLIPTVLLASPLLRTYPSLRKLVPTRTALVLLAVLLTTLLAGEEGGDSRWNEAIWALAITVGVFSAFLFARWAVGAARRESEERAAAGKGRHLLQVVTAAAAFAPPAALVAALILAEEVDRKGWNVSQLLQLIAATELWLAVTGVAMFCVLALIRARFSAPKKAILIPIAGLLATVGLTMVWDVGYQLPAGGGLDLVSWLPDIDVAQGVVAASCFLAFTLLIAGVVFLFVVDPPEKEEVTHALKKRDLKTREENGKPTMALFRAMAISGLPMLGQVAESTAPPFYKSFLTLDASRESGRTRLKFRIYGVLDERPPRVKGHPVSQDQPVAEGSYLVDEVVASVVVDRGG